MNIINKYPLPSLAACILLDLVGMASFSIPLVGEFSDVVWAPLSGLIYYRMFGGKMGMYGGIFNFLEEAMPGTDIIPTFTISWLMRYREMQKNKVSDNKVIVIK